MSITQKYLTIKTRTSGFSSPAESYVDKRLDLNELICQNSFSTFYFKYVGPNTLGVKDGDILVLDKSETPKEGDLVVLTDKTYFKIREYKGQDNLWGKVTWILTKK
jgi:SOS-response transcriptional repressor LexA